LPFAKKTIRQKQVWKPISEDFIGKSNQSQFYFPTNIYQELEKI
jgi:hypothetical protein